MLSTRIFEEVFKVAPAPYRYPDETAVDDRDTSLAAQPAEDSFQVTARVIFQEELPSFLQDSFEDDIED
jgi:hypothetical protein